MSFFATVLAALAAAEVRYVVVGGVAVVLHGHARLTMDLDLVVDLRPAEAAKAIGVLSGLGLRPLVPVDPIEFADPQQRDSWYRERNMLVFTMHNPDNPTQIVDLFVQSPIDFESLWTRSELVPLHTMKVRIASLRDLIQMKREAGRDKDLLDLKVLEQMDQRRRNAGR